MNFPASFCTRLTQTARLLGLGLTLLAAGQSARADLLVVSQTGNSVRRLSDAGVDLGDFVSAGSGGLDAAIGINIRASDNSILVSSFNTNSIKRYSGADGSYLGDFVTGTSSPKYSVFGPDGNLYVSNLDASITRYNGTTGASLGSFTMAGSLGIEGITFMPGGDLLVSNSAAPPEDAPGPASIQRYNGTTGAFIGDFVTGIGGPVDSTYGPDGNFYVTDRVGTGSGDISIKKYDGTTGAFISNFVTTNLSNPTAVVFGADNNLYVSNFDGNNVTRYNGTTGAFIDTFATGISGPRDLTYFNVAPVPEPSTWVMMVLGLGALGLMMRKRKRGETQSSTELVGVAI